MAESIPPGQARTGRQLYEALAPLPAQLQRPVRIEYVPIPDRSALDLLLHGTAMEYARAGQNPLLHFECHGNDDGISLASNEFVHWDDLCQLIAPINVVTRLNLFVSIAACLGSYVVTQLLPSVRAPFLASLSTMRPVYPDELYRGFFAFFSTLLRTLDGDEAYAQLLASAPDRTFLLIDAMGSFRTIYREYLARQCTREAYLRRAAGIQEVQQELGLPVASTDAIFQNLVVNEVRSFEKLRDEHFMVDLYPDNGQRFPVAFSEVDHRST